MKDKILIITQGTQTGANYELSVKIAEFLSSQFDSNTEIRIENADEMSTDRWKEIDPIKTLMVVPEWNGSFPYTFKKMIDESGYPSFFADEEVLLIGTSNSPFGNLMGVEHLAFVLRRCHARVHHRSFYVVLDHLAEKRMSAMLSEILDFCA